MQNENFSESSSGCLIDFSICNDSDELKRFVPVGATVIISMVIVLIKQWGPYIARYIFYHNMSGLTNNARNQKEKELISEILRDLKFRNKADLIFCLALILTGILMILFSIIKRHQKPLKIEDHMLYYKKKSWYAKDITLVKKCYSGKTKFYSGKKCIAGYYTDDYLTVFMWAETFGVKTKEHSLYDFSTGQRALAVMFLVISAIILSLKFLT